MKMKRGIKLHPYRPSHGSGGYSQASYREDPGSAPGVGFVVEIVVVGQTFVRVLRFSCVSIIPPLLNTHSFIYHRRCAILQLTVYFSNTQHEQLFTDVTTDSPARWLQTNSVLVF